jgi:hypothetical protein
MVLEKLRSLNLKDRVGSVDGVWASRALDEFEQSGVKFVASAPGASISNIEKVYYRAVHDLMSCVVESPSGGAMLIEGAVFLGCWLESTGSINSETLSRFCPESARQSFELFADYQREDGLIPYKLTSAGPSFRQVQMVTPFARSVWTHYKLNPDKAFLGKMYNAIAENDNWLAAWRNTRGTGCVEAFCTFDTGADASPRFWHVADTPFMGDPSKCDPDSPMAPFLAPDMTANAYCQRLYLAKMADELGIPHSWEKKAEESLKSLFDNCFDQDDFFFYDRDRYGRFVKVQSDNLIRVLACEVGDCDFFKEALRKYLLNTRKFFSRYPITTIAMDDPRFSQSIVHNSWAGQLSFLTELRLPQAFEHHGRLVELSWIMHPIITALSRFTRFAGGLGAWVGEEGYSENYTPTMLCLLDYIERMSGIFPAPNELRFTGLVPTGVDHGNTVASETAYSRKVNGVLFELANENSGCSAYRNGELFLKFPKGIRVCTDFEGNLLSVAGMALSGREGAIWHEGKEYPLKVEGNERLSFMGGENGLESVFKPGVEPPNHG